MDAYTSFPYRSIFLSYINLLHSIKHLIDLKKFKNIVISRNFDGFLTLILYVVMCHRKQTSFKYFWGLFTPYFHSRVSARFVFTFFSILDIFYTWFHLFFSLRYLLELATSNFLSKKSSQIKNLWEVIYNFFPHQSIL